MSFFSITTSTALPDPLITDPRTDGAAAPPPTAAPPVKPLSLRRNFSWTLAGNLVYAGCQWGMLIALAKLGSPELIGQFALGLAVTAPVIMFANLHLRAVQATDAKHEYQFGDYFALRLLTTAAAVLLIAAIAFSAYRVELALVILVIGLGKAFEAISDVIYGLLEKHERMDRIAKLQMVKGPLSLAAFGVTLWLTGSLLYAATALAAVWALRLIAWDLPSTLWVRAGRDDAPTIRPRWHVEMLRRLAWLGLPLGLATVLNSIGMNIPKYFIQNSLGERELGIFAAMAYPLLLGHLVMRAMAQAATPRLAKYHADGDVQNFKRVLKRLIGLAAALGAIGLIVVLSAGDRILTLLYGPEYAEYSAILAWLMMAAAMAFEYICLGAAIRAMRRFRIEVPIQIAGTAVLVILCSVLVNENASLMGAAIAMLAYSTLIAVAYTAVILHRSSGFSEADQAEHRACQER